MKYLLLLIVLFSTVTIEAQGSAFNHSAFKWPLGKVLHYQKSNWDGSNKGFVSIYFKEKGWVESIKWQEGYNQVSVIPAKINQKTFSVDHFKNIRCQDGDCNQMGEMFKDPKTGSYIINFGPIQDTIKGIPAYWHSYDFDWASLMVEFLSRERHKDHKFMRCDFKMVNGQPGFGHVGKINMIYKGESIIDGKSVHLYDINGEGLQNKGGKIWFDAETNQLMGFKIELPDEDSYQNVDFKFLSEEKITTHQWEEFKMSKTM